MSARGQTRRLQGREVGRISESCKMAKRGGFAAMTPQQPEEWELRRKTAEGSPKGAAAGRRQVKVGRLQRAQA